MAGTELTKFGIKVKELCKKYDVNQSVIAKLLGYHHTVISDYVRNMNGDKISLMRALNDAEIDLFTIINRESLVMAFPEGIENKDEKLRAISNIIIALNTNFYYSRDHNCLILYSKDVIIGTIKIDTSGSVVFTAGVPVTVMPSVTINIESNDNE